MKLRKVDAPTDFARLLRLGDHIDAEDALEIAAFVSTAVITDAADSNRFGVVLDAAYESADVAHAAVLKAFGWEQPAA